MSQKINQQPDSEEVMLFQVDAQIKEEFLDTQKKSTRTSYGYILGLADEYEEQIGKSIYDFNIEDRDELLYVKYKNKTSGAFQSTLSPLRKYVDYCIMKHLVAGNENRLASILPSEYEKYINPQAVKNSYISKSTVRNFEDLLINYQDKLILELLSWGMRGRTEKGNTLEEFVNLKIEDVDFDDEVLYLINNDGEQRTLYVDKHTIHLIKKTIQETSYIFNNGIKGTKNEFGENVKTEKGFPIIANENVFRIPGKNKSGKTDHQFYANRIQRIQRFLGKPYLTISNLYFSAMIDYAKELKKEKGNLEKIDYIKINEKFRFGGKDGEKYSFRTKELVSTYI